MIQEKMNNPYIGLRPFEVDESLWFYGRNQQITELLEKLYDTRFLAVVGNSGCGKSSLIRAGLIPYLKAGFLVANSDQWRIVVMKPGNRPLYQLIETINLTIFNTHDPRENERFYEHILTVGFRAVVERLFLFFHDTGANILILVDQFEEIFLADITNHEEAADFVSIILSLSQTKDLPIFTVLTMRSDFIGDCATFHKLPEAMNQSQYLVPKMTREQRRQAIEGPAAVLDINIPKILVQRLLNDISENSDQLPVLQHALMRTWDKWQQSSETPSPEIQHYEMIGGIQSALSQHADEIYCSLTPQDSLITEKIFKALTTSDLEGRGIRRNTVLKDLCDIIDAPMEKIGSILDQFRSPSCSFIMPTLNVVLEPDSKIDISHESLMRLWRRLIVWCSEEAASAKRYLRLAEAAELHEKCEAALLTDPELTIIERWQKENSPNAVWASRYHPGFRLSMNFLEKSIAAKKKEILQARKNDRNKNIFRFVIIAMFVLLGLSIFTGVQYQKVNVAMMKAEHSRKVSEKALENEANARQIAERAMQEAQKQKRIAENQRNKLKKQLDEILYLKDVLNPLVVKQGRLYVKAIPNNASITIDSDKIKRPFSNGMKLDAGVYSIKVSHKNYYEKKLKVLIEAGKEAQNPVVELLPLPGKMIVNVIPLDANVYLNGINKGKGNLELNDLKPDTYHIKLKKKGYAPVEKNLSVKPNQVITVSEHLVKYAQLTILPKPNDATVKIMNIRPVYSSGMYLLPGNYEIYVSKKGFVDFEETIHLNEGDEITMSVELKMKVL